jgi:precorrin-6A synthase
VRVSLIGVGPGDPEQVTLEAVRALREVDFFVLTEKSADEADPLARAREQLLERHLERPPTLARVADPARERRPERTGTRQEYDAAVSAWHDARVAAYEEALEAHPGHAGFLVWGDPAFYDSTIRILDKIRDRGRVPVDVRVVPGISSIQLLAARHGIVLHEIGQPLHVTTGRRLRQAIDQGQDNVLVMLNRDVDLSGLEDWRIWWGANLGTDHEEMVSGRVGDVSRDLAVARDRARAAAGWVMDLFLLRRGAG